MTQRSVPKQLGSVNPETAQIDLTDMDGGPAARGVATEHPIKSLIATAWVVLAVAALPGSSSAQGDGGSQTSCELQYSSCKQTAHADHQFCIQASAQNCRQNLNRALQQCTNAQQRCNQATGNY